MSGSLGERTGIGVVACVSAPELETSDVSTSVTPRVVTPEVEMAELVSSPALVARETMVCGSEE